MEERLCVCCGERFRVNPRARATHSYCAKTRCQSERRRVGQSRRRECEGRPALSEAGTAHHAAYMKSYRDDHPAYRDHENRQRREREREREPAVEAVDDAVREAGSSDDRAIVYVVSGRGPLIQLRVVTEGGLDVTVRLPEASGDPDPAVREAG